MTDEPTEPKERRAFLSLPEDYFDMSEDDQLAALDPMVDALLGEREPSGG